MLLNYISKNMCMKRIRQNYTDLVIRFFSWKTTIIKISHYVFEWDSHYIFSLHKMPSFFLFHLIQKYWKKWKCLKRIDIKIFVKCSLLLLLFTETLQTVISYIYIINIFSSNHLMVFLINEKCYLQCVLLPF